MLGNVFAITINALQVNLLCSMVWIKIYGSADLVTLGKPAQTLGAGQRPDFVQAAQSFVHHHTVTAQHALFFR